MPDNFLREKGARFQSRGLRTGSPADALQPGEYPMLQNVRGNTRSELTTRAGHVLDFATAPSSEVFGISAYADATGATRILAAAAGNIYLDNGAVVDSGYSGHQPSMIPYRPNQSPLPWMYVGDGSQYHKLSAPTATNAVTNVNAGIVEPQAPPVVFVDNETIAIVPAATAYTNSGTAGAVSAGTRTSDTIVAVFPDPAGSAPYTLQVGAGIQYQREQIVTSGGISDRIMDVFTPIPANIVISAIKYLSGSTGKCVIVPQLQAPGPGSDQTSIYSQSLIANLRRGALVKVAAEVCYVYDVEVGPAGTVCFTTSTTSHHTTADTLSGVPAIQVMAAFTPAAITSADWTFAVTTGIGTIQNTTLTSIFAAGGSSFQPNDYLHFSVNIDNLANLTEMKILIDVNNGAVNFTDNVFFYAVRPSDIAAGVQNVLTQLGVTQLYAQRQLIQQENVVGVSASAQTVPGNSQWSEIIIPISELIRIGNAQAQTLINMQGIQFLFNASGNLNVAISSIDVWGQYQVDVGNLGQPYHYRFRPRSSVTGAKGNPSPPTRYGVNPRRQQVAVVLPAADDAQTDLWDIYRFGGTLDSYRLVGTVAPSTTFFDNYADIALQQAEVLEFDNLQPWPTIDYPLTVATGVTVVGTQVSFSLLGGDSHITTISRWLPGNLIHINQTVYTLYTRPTIATLAVTLTLVENAGAVTNGSLYCYEPLIANQPLPYLWGPSAEGGDIFGVGDPFRPGTVQFSKNFNPDSVPSRFNVELTPPSEPLTGGCLLNGESFVFSAARCWALRPSFGGENQYTPRQVPTGVGALSHFVICSDGKHIFFVAKDGIYATSGGPAVPLTTRDNLYSLFPHEGVQGQPWTYAGVTIQPPQLGTPGHSLPSQNLRLAYANGFLYFDYIDITNHYSHLVYDLQAEAWYPDSFATAVTPSIHYSIPQEDSIAYSLVLAGTTTGNVLIEQYGVSDIGNAISCLVATAEDCPAGWAWSWFENPGIDIQPTLATALTAQGYSLGIPIGSPSSFQSASRLTQGIVDIGGGLPLKSLGVVFRWSQSYTGSESLPATLYLMEFLAVPYPEPILAQRTKATSHGLRGFQHLYLGQLAFIPTANPVTITLTPDQGPPITITIPPQPIVPYPVKFQFKIPANKFKMVTYDIASATQFYLWPEDCEMWIKEWGAIHITGRPESYLVVRPWGTRPLGAIA